MWNVPLRQQFVSQQESYTLPVYSIVFFCVREACGRCPSGSGWRLYLYVSSGCDLRVVLYTYRRDEGGRGHSFNMDWQSNTGHWIRVLTGHPVRSHNLIPTSCDFHFHQVFHYALFCLEASVAMHYCNHTGYVVCRLCVYYALYFYGLRWWHATSADARKL